jgi:hypothetical protein
VFASSVGGPAYLAFTDDAGVPLKLANQVPEPSAWAMMLGGASLLTGGRRFGRVFKR